MMPDIEKTPCGPFLEGVEHIAPSIRHSGFSPALNKTITGDLIVYDRISKIAVIQAAVGYNYPVDFSTVKAIE